MIKHSQGGYQKRGSRQNQEDCLGYAGGNIYCLCDGMGGHSDGEKASKLVTAAFLWKDYEQALAGNPNAGHSRFSSASPENVHSLFLQALNDANDALRRAKQSGHIGADAGCTLIALCICGDRAFFLSVGDSIILAQRNNHLEFINRRYLDTRWNELVRSGMSEEQAHRQPKSHGLVQAVVGKEIRHPHIFPNEGILLQPGDRIILASDGIQPLGPNDNFSPLHEILTYLPVPSTRADQDTADDISERVAQHIVCEVLETHTPNQDNVSVLVIDLPASHGTEVVPPPHRLMENIRGKENNAEFTRGHSIPSYLPDKKNKSLLFILIPLLLILLLSIPILFSVLNPSESTRPKVVVQPTTTKVNLDQDEINKAIKRAEDAYKKANAIKDSVLESRTHSEDFKKFAKFKAEGAEEAYKSAQKAENAVDANKQADMAQDYANTLEKTWEEQLKSDSNERKPNAAEGAKNNNDQSADKTSAAADDSASSPEQPNAADSSKNNNEQPAAETSTEDEQPASTAKSSLTKTLNKEKTKNDDKCLSYVIKDLDDIINTLYNNKDDDSTYDSMKEEAARCARLLEADLKDSSQKFSIETNYELRKKAKEIILSADKLSNEQRLLCLLVAEDIDTIEESKKKIDDECKNDYPTLTNLAKKKRYDKAKARLTPESQLRIFAREDNIPKGPLDNSLPLSMLYETIDKLLKTEESNKSDVYDEAYDHLVCLELLCKRNLQTGVCYNKKNSDEDNGAWQTKVGKHLKKLLGNKEDINIYELVLCIYATPSPVIAKEKGRLIKLIEDKLSKDDEFPKLTKAFRTYIEKEAPKNAKSDSGQSGGGSSRQNQQQNTAPQSSEPKHEFYKIKI